MTAINTFTDHECAYLAADGSVYDLTTGALIDNTSKVAMFEEQRMVIALTGRALIRDLVDAIDREHPIKLDADGIAAPTQETLLAAIPGALRRLKALIASLPAGPEGHACAGVFVALYDRAAARPRLLMAHTAGYPDQPDEAAYRLNELVTGYVMPPVTPAAQAALAPKGYWEDPIEHMRGLLMIQRRTAHSTLGCVVGGHCTMFRVHRAGVDWLPLLDFPDTIGQPMDAALLPIMSAAA